MPACEGDGTDAPVNGSENHQSNTPSKAPAHLLVQPPGHDEPGHVCIERQAAVVVALVGAGGWVLGHVLKH